MEGWAKCSRGDSLGPAMRCVIVDLSEAKPNVLYEPGTLMLEQALHSYLFDFDRYTSSRCQPLKTILYHPGQTHKLAKELAQRLNSCAIN
jgi:hypothetical protein